MKKIDVAISVSSKTLDAPIFSSGLVQNTITLFRMISLFKNVNVFFIVAEKNVNRACWLQWGINKSDIKHINDVSNIDLLIEAAVSFPDQVLLPLKKKGAKLVKYVMGNSYIFSIQKMLFDLKSGVPRTNTRKVQFDEIWTLPHHYKTCKSFLEIEYKAEVKALPYIWDEVYIDSFNSQVITELDKSAAYTPTNSGKKRVSIFEPNFDVVKTSLMPMIIAEKAHHKSRLIEKVFVTNTNNLKSNPDFKNFYERLVLHKEGLVELKNRFKLPYFLCENTDIIVTHQWENGLNNLYFDCLYFKYPLVHNSEFLKDAGYYYPEFDADKASEILVECIKNHDLNIESYDQNCEKILYDHSIKNPAVQNEYLSSIKRVCNADQKKPIVLDKKKPKSHKYSVIMMSYLGEYEGAARDREKKFIRSVDSFLNQEYKNSELIIISDGCEKTRKLYNKNYKKISRVKLVLSKKKEGVWPGKLRQKGIEKAEGDRILYLDSDDYISPKHIKMIDDKFTPDLDWVVSEGVMIPKKEGVYFNREASTEISSIEWQPSAWGLESIGYICIGNICHNKALDVKWDYEGLGEDVEFTKKLLSNFTYKKFYSLTYYVCHGATLDETGKRITLFEV